RRELKAHLRLDPGVEIVFSPSGTDSQLHALLIARALLGTTPVSIVVAADETGSGTVFSAAGRHFNPVTAANVPVEKGAPVAGLGEDGSTVAIPLRDGNGRLRTGGEVDAATIAAVAAT